MAHSAPATQALASHTVAAAHAHGIVPAVEEAADLLAAVGVATGLLVGVNNAVDGVRSRNLRQAAGGLARVITGTMGVDHVLDQLSN